MIMSGKNGNDLVNKSKTTFLFLDSSLEFQDYEKFMKKNDVKIITLDYESHKILKEKSIQHVISDTYLTLNEMDDIQSKSYDYTRWHENEKFKEYVTYEGISFGLLIQTEFNYFLVPFLKKFVEIKKIVQENKNSNFIISAILEKLIRKFSKNVQVISNTSIEEFYYDKVKIPIKIKNYSLSLNISKKNYDRMKRISGKLSNSLLKQNLTGKDSSILLVEFDPIRYRNLFLSMNEIKKNFSLYNVRRPPIWNKESFSIIKKSNCKIIDPQIKPNRKLYENDVKNVKKNLEHLFQLKEFEEFFSYQNESFWIIIQEILKNLLEKRVSEFIINIQKGIEIFEKFHFSSILVWSEIGSTEQILVKLAKQRGIPVILLQHGLFFDSGVKGAYEMNKFQGVYPIDADEIIVWGEIEKKHQIASGTPEDKIHVLGTPLFDNFSNTKNLEENIVTLATSGPVKENVFDLTVNTIERNIETIREICKGISKLHKKLFIKIHPSPDEFDPTELIQKIDKNIEVIKNGEITDFIEKSELFIIIDISTVIINAQMLKKPIISVTVKDSGYGIPSILASNSCLEATKENFELQIKKILNDKKLQNEIIEKSTNYRNNYVSNVGTASKKILNFLEEYEIKK